MALIPCLRREGSKGTDLIFQGSKQGRDLSIKSTLGIVGNEV
jgi:hypothetical protein